jgi:hypothetical protein
MLRAYAALRWPNADVFGALAATAPEGHVSDRSGKASTGAAV